MCDGDIIKLVNISRWSRHYSTVVVACGIKFQGRSMSALRGSQQRFMKCILCGTVYFRDGKLTWFRDHFQKAAYNGETHLLTKIEASLGSS